MTRFSPRHLGPLGCGLALLAACAALPDAGHPVVDGQSFPMQPGERVALSGHSALHYVGVTSDSRCPPAVQCIHAGNAVVAFRWMPSAGPSQDFVLNMPDQPRARDLGQRRLMLLELGRGTTPQATLRIERLP